METNYEQVFVDFDDLSTTEFWRLGDTLSEIPNIRLKPTKGHHHFGILQLLLKHKSYGQIEKKEISTWEELRWRPIQSYRQYCWGPWLAHMGKTFDYLSKMIFPLGDAVSSTAEVQKKIFVYNKKHGG